MIICSGGIDSVTTAYVYKQMGYEVGLIHFMYGQAAQEVERYAVEQIAKRLDAKLYVYDAKPIFANFRSLLLQQTKADPKKRMLDAESTLSYVPARNLIMASITAGIAEQYGYDIVSFGAQQMDASAYPDNTPSYVDKVNDVYKYALNWRSNIKFTAPLQHLIKHEIVKLGLAINVPYNLVCSCYYPKLVDGQIVNCGNCGCDSFRMNAFKMLGIKDVQKYARIKKKFYKDCKDVTDVIKINGEEYIERYVKSFM